jgi:hypothetical protein
MMKRLVWIAVAIVAPSVARAQNLVTVGSNDATVKGVAPGAQISVPLLLDMSAANGTSIDSIATSLFWNPAVVTLDSVKAEAFGSFPKFALNRTGGLLDFGARSSSPVAATTTLATLYFTAALTGGGTHLSITPTDASLAGAHLAAGQLVGWSQDICVAPTGLWGDADGNGQVDIMDAQQIARAIVGDAVVDSTAVVNNGDINADGEVDILDAQGVARFAVLLSAPPRTNQNRGAIPDTHALTMNRDALDLPIGSTASLSATPFDANGFSLVGCQGSTWVSDHDGIVHVNATGQITALSSGTAIITATSGTVTAQSVVTVP